MNADPRFLRVRIRQLMPFLAAAGIEAAEIAASARRIAAAADLVDDAASRAIAKAVVFDALAIAWLDPQSFFAEAEEVRLRVLTRLLQAIAGEPYPPSLDKLEAVDGAMRKARGRFKRTLAGAVVERRGRRLAFYREAGREGLPEVAAEGASRLVWDNRFEITIGDGVPPGVMVGPLGEASRRALGLRAESVPPDALSALPALRRGPEILAIPSLSWLSSPPPGFPAGARPLLEERTMTPRRFPVPPEL